MSEASKSKQPELVQELQDKATRDSFVSSQMSIPLAFQIQALREQQGLTQKQLAEKSGMLQPRIAAMERPSGSEPNLRTLKRLASAFDVALIVRFAPFSELVEWAGSFSPDTFKVPSFEDDPGFQESVPASAQAETTTSVDSDVLFTDSFQKNTNLRTVVNIDVGQIVRTIKAGINLTGSSVTVSRDETPLQPATLHSDTSKGEIIYGRYGRAA